MKTNISQTKTMKKSSHIKKIRKGDSGTDNKNIKPKNPQRKKLPGRTSSGSLEKTTNPGEVMAQLIGMPDEPSGGLLFNQIMHCLPSEMRNQDSCSGAVLSMLHGINPQDTIEGMLAAQMVAVHMISLNMSGRCVIEGQTIDAINSCVNRMTKLTRTFTNQMEALQRYRGKGKQTIQVQHVQVNEGGQAVVGNVQGGGGDG
jgi:hypothetical protein